RRVPGRGHLLAELEAVVLVEDVEQLRVGVVPLLTRVRVRRVRRDRVRHHLPLGTVLGPIRDRVAQLLPDPPSKVFPSSGPYRCPSTLSSERFSNSTTTTWSSACSRPAMEDPLFLSVRRHAWSGRLASVSRSPWAA